MAPYNYNNYYDPVGNQNNNQQHGYTYQTSGANQYPSQATANYQANYSQSYGNAYAGQQYGTNTQQQSAAASTTNRNASTLNSLTGSSYPQNTTSNRSSGNASSYDTNTYYASAGFAAMNDRNQSNNSPLYAAQTGASTFGRLSLPDQSQSTSTYGGTQSYQNPPSNASTQYRNAPSSASSSHRSYKNAYNQAQNQTQPPQRYASPLHAVQAQQQQHGHTKQPSRSSNHQPSPQMSVQNVQQHQRQTSASVEPSPTTVDPTQVYDFRAEQQRKAQVEAEKRKQREAERAARKAEEDARKQEEERRVAEEKARKEEQERLEKEKREAEEKAKKAEEEATKKKAAQDRKKEKRRKAREEKRQSQTAATALTQMASGSAADAALAGMPGVGDMSAPPANDEEAEMRAMFKKMREFNARNPTMLAKLWEEERQTHASQQSSPSQPAAAKPAQAAPAKKQQPQATPANAGQQGQQVRPFKAVNTSAQPASQTPTQKTATPTQQASGALWPPHKKGSLAEAAAKWLNNLPQNRHLARSISKEAVLKILDGNPSYVQLCESLETTGIKFERSDLAKELLKAVPEVRQQKPGAPTVNGLPTPSAATPVTGEPQKRKPGRPKKDQLNYSTAKPSQGNGPVNYQAPVFSLANAAREVNSMSTAGGYGAPSSLASAIASAQGPSDTSSPYFMDQPAFVEDTGPESAPIEVKDEEKPEEPPKPPADKEEAARKRTFNDLVDLTKDNDSDDEGPPRKLQQPIAGPSNGAVKHQPQTNGFSKPMTFQQFLNRTQPVQSPAPYHTPYGPNQQQYPPRPMPVPSQVPSNARPSGPTEEQKQQERMRGKMLVEPIMRDRVTRKSKYDSRTIARDVLLATGRHPDMRPLNAHLSSMQRLLADHGGAIDGAGNKSDLSTIRWDIIDPGEPAEDAKAKVKSAAERRGKAISGAADVDDEEEANDEGEGLTSNAEAALRKIRNGEELREEDVSNIEDPMVRKQIKNRIKVRQQSEKYKQNGDGDQDQGGYVSVKQQIRQSSGANPKKRGRPPKSATNSQRASPAVHHNLSDTNNDILGSDLTPKKSKKKRASDASPAMSSGGKAVGYAAFKQYDENGNEIKRKGRPVGWRKSIHSREAHGLDPAKSGGAYKPSGSRLRPSAGPSPSIDRTVQPQYQVYKCRWTDCGAQLDNLERLKKHVVKLHGNKTEEDRFECQWQPCRSQGRHVNEEGKAREGEDGVASFDTIEYWMKHVNKQHLDEVAWKLGDGPRGGSISEQHTYSEAYLSDAQGRSVTPRIIPLSELTEDPSQPILTSNIKGKGKAAATAVMTKDELEAAAEIKKLTDQKLREGVVFGREGTRLATDERRATFRDDEDFEDIIIDSD